MPLLSIVVPVYNVESYLSECVDSILNQTFKEFELILVNDGSQDNSLSICEEYAKLDKRVIIINKENGGLSSARNAGLNYASSTSNSKFISFVDADDYLDNHFAEKMISAIIKNNCDVSACGIISFEGKNYKSFDKLNPGIVPGNEIFLGDNVFHYFTITPAKIYSIKSIGNKRFIDKAIHEDEFFSNNYYSSNNIKIATIPDQLYFYRQHQNSIMHNLGAYSYICSIKALFERVHLLRKKRFVHTRKELILFSQRIMLFFDLLMKTSDVRLFENDIKKLLLRSYFVLPIFKQSLSFRLHHLKYLF